MSEQPHVLITGAANGIGRATAPGAGPRERAAGPDRHRRDGLASAGQGTPGRGATFAAEAADVTEREALSRAVRAIEAALGPVDVLVACAGFGTLTLVPDLDLDTLRQTLEVNCSGSPSRSRPSCRA